MNRNRYEKVYGFRLAERCCTCLHGEWETDETYNCLMMQSNNIENIEVRDIHVCNSYERTNKGQKTIEGNNRG